MAEVQVYIPVFNAATSLERTIRSALMQENVDLEVIVSDNASTDGSYEIALRFSEQDARVRVHRSAHNLGHTANFNLVASYVDAPFYIFLCSDDVLLSPHALQMALTTIQQHEDMVSVYCDMMYIDGQGRKLSMRRFRQGGEFDARKTLRRSIITRRNLFGIAILHRTTAGASVKYPDGIEYTSDIFHSAKVAERGRVYHIAEPLIGNRYTGRNLTQSLRFDANAQFDLMARQCGIALTRRERAEAAFFGKFYGAARGAFLAYARYRSRGSGK